MTISTRQATRLRLGVTAALDTFFLPDPYHRQLFRHSHTAAGKAYYRVLLHGLVKQRARVLGFVAQTQYANEENGGDIVWRDDEVDVLLEHIRRTLTELHEP